jgi:5'-nucleotidase
MSKKLILVSNDDGIHAEGLTTLVRFLEPVGDVWVVAPDREQSAMSHAISLHKPLRLKEERPQWFSVDGTPADCVYMALHHVLPRPPDVVVSGINHGPNLGNDVLYSGTVSAAMEGALFGYPSIAVSLCVAAEVAHGGGVDVRHFASAGQVAQGLAVSLLSKRLPVGVLLNVNVPDVSLEKLKGTRLCRLGHTDWADKVTVRQDPRHRPYYWIGGERLGPDGLEDSDNTAVSQGYVAVTPVHHDLTDYRVFEHVQRLDIPASPLVHGVFPVPHEVGGVSARGSRTKKNAE